MYNLGWFQAVETSGTIIAVTDKKLKIEQKTKWLIETASLLKHFVNCNLGWVQAVEASGTIIALQLLT